MAERPPGLPPMPARQPPPRAPRAPRAINLALQGGGSHGAFTWGVLDALLEDGRFCFDGVSGTSAGAMNAVVLAHGFAQAAEAGRSGQDARETARAALSGFWNRIGQVGSLINANPLESGMSTLAPEWQHPMDTLMSWYKPWLGLFNITPPDLTQMGRGANPLTTLLQQWITPYNANPLDINPLRDILQREVDFDLLQRHAVNGSTPSVFVSATNVRTGRGEVFSGQRLSCDAVMASACLPTVFKAVEIEGQYYWDGGYSGNPAIYPLIYETCASDVLLVQINPIEHLALPDQPYEISDRINEITFNAGLLAELRAIAFVRRLLAEGKLDPGRYKNIHMHRIDGGASLAAFGASSKMGATLPFVRQLFELGRAAGVQWLADHADHVGQRPTFDVTGHDARRTAAPNASPPCDQEPSKP